MNFSKLSVIFLLSFWIDCCVCTLFSSSFEISQLLKSEKKLLENLNGFFEKQEKNGLTFDPAVREFVSSAEEINNRSSEDTGKIENPLSVFYLISRAVGEWEELKKNLSCDEEKEDCPLLTGEDVINVVRRRDELSWPTEANLKQAARALVNVWDVYDLDLQELANGKIGNVKDRPLTADELFTIANAARDYGMTYEAISLFEHLLSNLENLSPYTFKISSLYRRLALSYREYGLLGKGIELLKDYLKTDSGDNGVARDIEYLETTPLDKEADETEFVRLKGNDTATAYRRQFEEYCRDAIKGQFHTRHNMKCSLVPLYQCYGNVKVEMVSKRPKIEIMYDVISDDDAEEIMAYGENSFGNFYEVFPEKPSAIDYKLKSSPLCEWKEEYPLMNNLTIRLERMTRFKMYPANGITSSECYTLTNEGPGYISEPRTDYWPDGQQPFPLAGNRLATIMLQLSDVEYGGTLMFPRLNVTVPLKKGSAVVWSNLRANGKPTLRSAHTNCPVMIGSNWSLFKHVLYTNQVFRQPCEAK